MTTQSHSSVNLQIIPQLYMFVPSALLGFIIGMTIWIINLVIIRLFGMMRKSFNSNLSNENKTDDLDLKLKVQGLGHENLWANTR